jgi:glucokinase
VLDAPNLRWHNVAAATMLAKKVNLPVTLDNDVNVGTWGAYSLGAGKGSKSLFGIFVGTGIGGGFVIDGNLMHGVYGTAGEVGHVVIDAYAPHGLRTLEQLASRTAIVNRLVQMISANHASELPTLAGKRWPRLRSKVLARAYEGKDPLTVQVVNDAARAVGIAIANVVTLLSIDCVVVGGGVTEALGDRWMKEIQTVVNATVFPEVCRKCKVVASTLGDDAGLIGAALLARERLG